MRSFAAFLLMFIMPLQFAWSAVVSVHGHVGGNPPVLGVHSHAHDHGHGDMDPGHAGHDVSPSDDTGAPHGEDGHHAGHSHPVFTPILASVTLSMAVPVANGPIQHPPGVLISRTPPPLDRPPLALA